MCSIQLVTGIRLTFKPAVDVGNSKIGAPVCLQSNSAGHAVSATNEDAVCLQIRRPLSAAASVSLSQLVTEARSLKYVLCKLTGSLGLAFVL